MDRRHSELIAVIAGGAAGASETLCTYPAEYVKTRRQIPVSGTSFAQKTSPTSFQLLRNTIRKSGIRGLYAGCSALIVSNTAKGSVRFLSFSQSQAFFNKSRLGRSNPGLCTVLAGLVAGVTESVLVVTPGEALKTKIVHDRTLVGGGRLCLGNLMNLAQVAVRVIQTDGIKTLWNGLTPVMCKQGTNSAVRFATFGVIQERLQRSGHISGTPATLTAGAASGVVTTYASMPFDNIKTRMQVLASTKNLSMLSLAVQMLRTESITVFWRATTPRLVRLTMSSAVTFAVFNQISLFLTPVEREQHVQHPL